MNVCWLLWLNDWLIDVYIYDAYPDAVLAFNAQMARIDKETPADRSVFGPKDPWRIRGDGNDQSLRASCGRVSRLELERRVMRG